MTHMSELSTAMAKLSRIRKALITVLNEKIGRFVGVGRSPATYPPDHVQHYFAQAADRHQPAAFSNSSTCCSEVL